MMLFVVLLAGLRLAVPAQTAPAGHDSTLQSYHDAVAGFSYSYPAEFQSQPQFTAALSKGMTSLVADPENGAMAKCLAVPLGATKGTATGDGSQFAALILVRVDHVCLGEPGSAELLGTATQQMMKMLSMLGNPLTEDAVHYKLDGHEAAFVQGSVPAKMLGEGRMLHAGSVCALLGKTTACWVILSTDHKEMPRLAASPVTFDGRVPVPLVPKELAGKW